VILPDAAFPLSVSGMALPPASEKYELAAKLAEWQIAGPHRCADPVVDEITASGDQQRALNAGRQQQQDPREWFGDT
jgi:hypothetical protein